MAQQCYTLHTSSPIGKGGHAVVYRCSDQYNRQYAAKRFARHSKRSMVEKEVQILRSLRDAPCAVRLLEEVRTPPPDSLLDFVVMELCDSSIEEGLHISDPAFKPTMRSVFSAVAALHSHGVIHGDLKPSNILRQGGAIKLCDFGNAHRMEDGGGPEGMVHVEHLYGTPFYMAPENLTQRYCAKSDTWSLGVMLYAFAHHQCMPFTDSDSLHTSKLWASILFKEPRYNVEDGALASLLQHMLRKDVCGRATVQECLGHDYLRQE